MTSLGAGSRCQESTVITFEWDLLGLKEIFESSKDDEKSPLIASSLFGGGRWQLHFYASAARASSCSLYIAAVPTAEELRAGAQTCLSQGGWPRENAQWARRGPFSFTFEIKSLDGTIPIVAKGPHEPMTRREFSSSCSTWGYPQYVRRTEIFGDRAVAKANNGVKIICTMTYPLSPLPYPPPPPPTVNPLYKTVPTDVIDSVVDLFDNPLYSDVVFKFPSRDGSSFRSLYASKRILVRRSEYFKSLFEGGFAEGSGSFDGTACGPDHSSQPAHGARFGSLASRVSRAPARLQLPSSFDSVDPDDSDNDSDYDYNDGDEDVAAGMDIEPQLQPPVSAMLPPQCGDGLSDLPQVDIAAREDIVRAMTPESLQSDSDDGAEHNTDHLFSHPIKPVPIRTAAVPPATPSMQTVVVRDAAYLTYRTLLFALYTDEISFAPLSSLYHTDRATAFKNDFDFPYTTRKAYVKSRIPTPKTESQKRSPFPSSPKSLYKLADKLDLQRIKSRSFQAIKESLNPSNVTSELFGSFSTLFPEIRKVEMDYLLSHWDDVSHTDGMMYDMNPFSPSSALYSSTPLPTARSSRPCSGYIGQMQHQRSTANQDLFIQLLHSLRPKSRRNHVRHAGSSMIVGSGDAEGDVDDMHVEVMRHDFELEV